jgi:hypothetical protein
MKRFFRKKDNTGNSQETSRQRINPFIKTVIYIFLFVVIPAFFVDLDTGLLTFEKAFMPGILFLVFLFSKVYIFLNCLKLVNKWYFISDAFFIVFFIGLYHNSGGGNGYFTLLFFTGYTTFFHFYFVTIDIVYEALKQWKEKILEPKRLFRKRMTELIDIIKPVISGGNQFIGNFGKERNKNHDMDIELELVARRFFNSIDNREFPITCSEIIKIYQDLNINIFKQRRYNKAEFLNILITLDLIKSDYEFNNLKRHKNSPLKNFSLGGNLKKLLQVIAVLKDVDCPSTCAKDIYDYWIAIESSLNVKSEKFCQK